MASVYHDVPPQFISFLTFVVDIIFLLRKWSASCPPMGTTMVITMWGTADRIPTCWERWDIGPEVRDQRLSDCHANLADGEAEDFLKIRRLTDEEQVEGPAAAKVGHDDGIHRHGGEEVTPWGFEFLPGTDVKNVMNGFVIVPAAGCRKTHLSCTDLMHFFTNCCLDVGPLLLCYCRVLCRTSICQQEPRDIPYDPKNTYL